MKSIWTFVWLFLVVLLVLATVAAGFGLWHGADLYFTRNGVLLKSGNEGPHVFRHGDEWIAQTVRGDGKQGFHIEESRHADAEPFEVEVTFPLDESRFTVRATARFDTPPIDYRDGQPILAISDIEGNYRTFRDFLVSAKVIDSELNWTFASGHLVLLGDFVDRGASVTQVLWLIYKLERDAEASGGRVHYILGNHEIKALQGNQQSSHDKYLAVSAILGRQPSELFGADAFLGRWLASKNTIETINGIVLVHGGLHPALAEKPWSLEDLNRIVRDHYRRAWYPKRHPDGEDVLIAPATGPSWYRGYFKDDLTQAQVERTLDHFDATAVVVGHTLQWRVKSLFEGKVFAIDVKHPIDHRVTLPPRRSEALWLEGGKAWRVREDGSREAL